MDDPYQAYLLNKERRKRTSEKKWDIVTLISFLFFSFAWCVSEAHCDGTKDKLTSVMHEAARRNVVYTDEEGMASGVILTCHANYAEVLTNFHVLGVNDHPQVNKKDAKVTKVDSAVDLIILRVPYDCPEPITMPSFGKVEALDLVLYVGNDAGLLGTVSTGRVTGTDDDLGYVWSDALAMGGCSGSGLWNEKGELVGINEGGNSSNPPRAYLLRTINIERIKKFLH